MRRRRRQAAALAALACACLRPASAAASGAPAFPLPDLGASADTIPALPSPVPLDRSPLPRTSVLGYPEGAKFPVKDLLEEQTRTFFPPAVATLPMADIVMRAVGSGTTDLRAFRRAADAAIPATFAEDSNLTVSAVAVRPASAVPVAYAPAPDGLPFPPAGGDGGELATEDAADVSVSLALAAASSVHLTSPVNFDYGFARLLEDRLEAALRREGLADADVRILPLINTTFLRPAAPVLLRLPRQLLVAVTAEICLRGDPAPPPGGGARLLPFDGPRQTAFLEVIDTLLINRTGLVQASLDSIVARAGTGRGAGGAGPPPPRRALRAGPAADAAAYDEVNATLFLLSASSGAGVRDALQTVLTRPDPAAVPAAGDRPMLVQGLALEGLAVVGAALAGGEEGLDEAVTRAPRFQLAALVGEAGDDMAAVAARRRVVIGVMSALAAACVAALAVTLAVMAVRARRQAVAMGGTAKASSGTDGDGGGGTGGGGTGSSAGGGGPSGKAAAGLASGSSLGTRSVRGGLFAAMLGAGGPAVTVPPPTLRRAQPDEGEAEEAAGGGASKAAASAAPGRRSSSSARPLPPPDADAEWEVDPADLTIATRPDGTDWLLGTGGAGAVFRGARGGVGDVAIKLLQRGTPRDRAALAAEARLLRRVSRDAGVVQFYGACLTGPCPLLVLEYMAGGDLYAAIGDSAAAAGRRAGRKGGGEAAASPGLPSVQWWAAGRRLALDVARGLHFLHSSRVRHGDLKSSNILLTAGRTAAKIGDVGLAKVLGSHTTAAAGGGTYAYAAPEVLMNARCDERSDMWSFGVLVWELCTLGRPDRGSMRAVAVPAEAPPAIAALIADCMANDPDARPTAKAAFDAIAASPERPDE